MKKVFGLLALLMLLATPVMAVPSNYHTNYIYRTYNPVTGEHLFTSSHFEAYHLVTNGWYQEGNSWLAVENYGTPVYRLYNAGLDDHLFTSSEEEINMLLQNGWVADFGMSPVFYSFGPTPIYRLYNPALGRHLLTVNESEYNALAAQGDWSPEGIAFYGVEPRIDPNLNQTNVLGNSVCPDIIIDNGQIMDHGGSGNNSGSYTDSTPNHSTPNPPQYEEENVSYDSSNSY